MMLWKCCLRLNCLAGIVLRFDNRSVNYRTCGSILAMGNLKMNNAFVKTVTLHLATSMLNIYDIHACNLQLSTLNQQASTEHASSAKHCSKSSSRHGCVTWEELITTKTTRSCCVAVIPLQVGWGCRLSYQGAARRLHAVQTHTC